jgi:transposase
MTPRKKPAPSSDAEPLPGNVARSAHATLRSYAVGALPILNHLLQRTQLAEILQAYLPQQDRRVSPPPVKVLLALVRNLLVAREPIYGLGAWAARYAPDLLDLAAEELPRLNDDRGGRCLDQLFLADIPSLSLAFATGVVRAFQVELAELHNDSTTITFSGAYSHATAEKRYLGRPTLAITFGHNKDHRPDLKQLLYLLTVSEDGGVPLHFSAKNGNTADDQTHRETWDLLCKLAGRCDFLYVADCKLASRDNLAYLAQRGGRFVTVLPRTRSEDAAFRQRLRAGQVRWQALWDKTDEQGEVCDRFSICDEPAVTAEGYRLLWYHSTHKAELDAATRATQVERALQRLGHLRQKLLAPRTRYRQAEKVQRAVDEILAAGDVADFLRVEVLPREQEHFRQEKRGRPGPETRYVKSVRTRFDLRYEAEPVRMAAESVTDGVFPLVSNAPELTPREVLHSYKRQPTIEKRFAQLKTDFAVAPVYLKEARRIEALLAVYFFALVVEALLERELRQAMQRAGIEALPLYPEGRSCRSPTARRILDLFEDVQRHELHSGNGPPTVMVTQLTPLQRKILKLLGLSRENYGH